MLDQITRETMTRFLCQAKVWPLVLVCFWSYYAGVSLFGTICYLKTLSFLIGLREVSFWNLF